MAVTLVRRSSPADVKARLLRRFNYADSYRKQWDQQAIESYKLYVGHRDPLPPERQGRSNLHIPRVYEQVDALRSRIVKSFFSNRPYVDFVPKPNTDLMDLQAMEANARKAEVAAALVDDQLERNRIYRLWYDYVTSFLVFPAAIMAVGWRYETQTVRRRVEEPVMGIDPLTGMPVPLFDPYTMQPMTQMIERETVEPVWDDNELTLVDFSDWWGDPRGWDIDSCRFAFHREQLSRDELESRLEMLDAVGIGETFRIDWDEVGDGEAYLSEGKWERMASVGRAGDVGGDHWDEGEKPGKPHEVLHYWTDEEHGIIVNRRALVYYGDTPFWRHRKKPFVVSSFDPLPGELYGMSAVQIIEHLQHELNTVRNQRIDNVSFILNRMWGKRRGAELDESELVSRPGGIIEMDRKDDVWPFESPADVTQSAAREEAIIKSDMENAVGVAPVVRGVSAAGQQTATEIANQTSSAAIRFDVKIRLYQEMGLERLAYLMDCNNQQFLDRPRLVRLFGDMDSDEWQMVRPGEIVGEFDYRPAGSNVDPAANKEVRRQQLAEMIEAIHKLNMPYFNRYRLAREWAQTFDLRNIEGLMVPEDDLLMMAVQMVMAQMGPAAGSPGGPLAPQPGGPGIQPGMQVGMPPMPMVATPPGPGLQMPTAIPSGLGV